MIRMFKGGKGGILSVEIPNEDALYEHYMAFVQGGGVFVPTKKSYELGDDIFFLLSIYLR
ncbi:MAG: pilus assembly protein PilZ, partial [Porticoccaceae bacterium]|nr:pilus assembly protein PilZ [Porticoccaceae bacterium]